MADSTKKKVTLTQEEFRIKVSKMDDLDVVEGLALSLPSAVPCWHFY